MKIYFNKLIVCMLCLSFLFSMIPVYSKANFDGGFEPAEYSEAISMINDLGLLQNIDFSEYGTSKVMNRGEFSALCVNMLGLSSQVDGISYVQRFSDVPYDNEYANEINFATSLGIFNGISETEFGPDEPVYISQAVKVAVSMLGYSEMAQFKGGYPAGYLAVARDLGILNGVNMESTYPAQKGNVIVLMYNTLFTDIMDIKGVDGDSFSYEITEGVNFLSVYHKIYEAEGIVTANCEYSIYDEHIGADYIKINGKRYYTKSPRAIGSVGKNVKYYYKTIGDTDVLLTLREYENDVVIIDASENYTFDYANGKYTVNGIDKEYVFKVANYDIVYNHAAVCGNTPIDYQSVLSPSEGTITLIDNNMDKVFDVVIIEEAKILLLKNYDVYSETLYDTKDRSRDIKLRDYDYAKITDVNDIAVDLSKLDVNTVIMVYKSIDGKSVKLIVCENTVEGIVKEINDDGIIIGSDTYGFSSVNRMDSLAPGQSYKSIISPGQSYKFYLNQFNKIVYHEVKSTHNLGYIADIASLNHGVSLDTSALIYISSDELVEIKLADKVIIETINGKSTFNKSQVASKLQEYADEIYGYGVNTNGRLFVQYGLNSDKELNSIVIPYVLRTKSDYDNPPSNYSFFKLDYILTQFAGSGVHFTAADDAASAPDGYGGKEYYRLSYVPANHSAGMTMTFDDTASVFYVPEYSNTTFGEKNFFAQPVSDLKRNEYMYYFTNFDGSRDQMEAYSTSGDVRLVNNLVWIKANGFSKNIVNSAEDNALVIDVANVLSNEGDSLVKLTVLESRSTYDIYSDNLDILSRTIFEDTPLTGASGTVVTPTLSPNKTKIVPGDLIRFSTNANGYIEDIALMYDSENDMISYRSDKFTKHTVQYRHTCGEVTDLYGDYAVFNVYDSSLAEKTPEPHLASSYRRIYVYDRQTKTARLGDKTDLSIGDKVYLTMYYTLSTDGELIIYKGESR